MKNGMTKNDAITENLSPEERKARKEAALRFIAAMPEVEVDEAETA